MVSDRMRESGGSRRGLTLRTIEHFWLPLSTAAMVGGEGAESLALSTLAGEYLSTLQVISASNGEES